MLRTESVSYSYPEGTEAVHSVDLQFKTGEFTALMGANGSGKTTLLKLLIGLLKPSSGRIFLGEKDFRSLPEKEIFNNIGMVFQDPNDQLFAATVEQDVAFGIINQGIAKNEIPGRVEEALRCVAAAELKNRGIHTLSYGQKKRIALAGVIAMEPEVILLDEPTGGLDPRSTNPIMNLLKQLNREKGITIIMATHDVELAPLFCDRIVILDRGSVAAQGTPVEIFARPEIARGVSLRLPRLAHLAEIMAREDGVTFERVPLTISDARKELLRIYGKLPNQTVKGKHGAQKTR